MAECDRAAFDVWKSKGSKDASSTDSSQEDMSEIVSSEKTELDVIKSYCVKDVRKIREFHQQRYTVCSRGSTGTTGVHAPYYSVAGICVHT